MGKKIGGLACGDGIDYQGASKVRKSTKIDFGKHESEKFEAFKLFFTKAITDITDALELQYMYDPKKYELIRQHYYFLLFSLEDEKLKKSKYTEQDKKEFSLFILDTYKADNITFINQIYKNYLTNI